MGERKKSFFNRGAFHIKGSSKLLDMPHENVKNLLEFQIHRRICKYKESHSLYGWA